MDHAFCPGAGRIRQPAPELFDCPGCGAEVEIWTDEFRRDCPSCGRTVYRDGAMSCLDWCKYGEECVGEDALRRYRSSRAAGIRQRLMEKVRELRLNDPSRIERAEAVLRFAEELLETEKADAHIVIPASILAGLKSGSEPVPSGLFGFLGDLGFSREDLERIAEGIDPPAGDPAASPNRAVLHDALRLADLRRAGGPGEGGADGLLTATARRLAGRPAGGR